jgi:hypothetical protein
LKHRKTITTVKKKMTQEEEGAKRRIKRRSEREKEREGTEK